MGVRSVPLKSASCSIWTKKTTCENMWYAESSRIRKERLFPSHRKFSDLSHQLCFSGNEHVKRSRLPLLKRLEPRLLHILSLRRYACRSKRKPVVVLFLSADPLANLPRLQLNRRFSEEKATLARKQI